MREILFRGKSKENGEWVEGGTLIQDSGMVFITNENNIEYPEWIDKDTFGQYTGLTDKNGKKIFEGDIVRRALCRGLHTDYIVAWVNNRGRYMLEHITYNNKQGYLDMDKDFEVEVIGNKWDNPELLK